MKLNASGALRLLLCFALNNCFLITQLDSGTSDFGMAKKPFSRMREGVILNSFEMDNRIQPDLCSVHTSYPERPSYGGTCLYTGFDQFRVKYLKPYSEISAT